jgi:hypothetical protein
MVATKTVTTASIILMPSPCKASRSSTSKAVMIIAHAMGMWKSKFKATALPSDSARSVAAMAISMAIQFGQRDHLGYQSRQHWARSLPVATPRRAAMT